MFGTVSFASALICAGVLGVLIARWLEPDAAPVPLAILHIVVAPTMYLLRAGESVGPGTLAFSTILIGLLVALSLVDMRSRTIPDLLSFALIGFGMAHTWAYSPNFLSHAGAVVILLIASAVTAKFGQKITRAIGAGDVMLIAGGLAWLGPALMPDLLIGAAIVLVFGTLPIVITRRETPTFVPFAPAFGVAFCVIWLVGPIF